VTQRDINCLTDPDRSTRKRALEKILKTLGDLAKVGQKDSHVRYAHIYGEHRLVA
jgi:hypothetical protein